MSLSSNYSSQCRLRFYSLPLTFSFLFLLPTRLFQLIYPLGSLYFNLSSLDNTSIFKLSILTQVRFLSIFSKLFSFDHLLSSSSPSSKVFLWIISFFPFILLFPSSLFQLIHSLASQPTPASSSRPLTTNQGIDHEKKKERVSQFYNR